MTYYKIPHITDWQKQIILGTVLGGSSLQTTKGLNCFLSMRGKNGKWLQCKAQEINFSPPNPFYQEKQYFRWRSRCSPVFNQFRELMYENGKKVAKMEVLDSLRDIGLAVWFLDAGILKNHMVSISLKSFEEESIKVISEYFKQIDIGNEINRKKITMDENSTIKFIKTIGVHIPEFFFS